MRSTPGMRFVGVPLARRLRARHAAPCWPRSSASGRRSSFSPIRTIRPATCSRRPTIEDILRAAPGLVVVDEAYYAFADASFLPRVARVSEPARAAHGVEDRDGGRAAGLRGRGARVDRRTRQGAPAVQSQRADAGGGAGAAGRERAARGAGGDAAGRARARCMRRWRRWPASSAFPTQTNFVLARVPDAPRWFDALAARRASW